MLQVYSIDDVEIQEEREREEREADHSTAVLVSLNKTKNVWDYLKCHKLSSCLCRHNKDKWNAFQPLTQVGWQGGVSWGAGQSLPCYSLPLQGHKLCIVAVEIIPLLS